MRPIKDMWIHFMAMVPRKEIWKCCIENIINHQQISSNFIFSVKISLTLYSIEIAVEDNKLAAFLHCNNITMPGTSSRKEPEL